MALILGAFIRELYDLWVIVCICGSLTVSCQIINLKTVPVAVERSTNRKNVKSSVSY